MTKSFSWDPAIAANRVRPWSRLPRWLDSWKHASPATHLSHHCHEHQTAQSHDQGVTVCYSGRTQTPSPAEYTLSSNPPRHVSRWPPSPHNACAPSQLCFHLAPEAERPDGSLSCTGVSTAWAVALHLPGGIPGHSPAVTIVRMLKCSLVPGTA